MNKTKVLRHWNGALFGPKRSFFSTLNFPRSSTAVDLNTKGNQDNDNVRSQSTQEKGRREIEIIHFLD